MPPPVSSILLIRVLAGLHGIPLLAGLLLGAFWALGDLGDDGGGVNDHLGLVLGGVLVVGTLVPLLVVLAAVVSREPVVVRILGFTVGVLSMGCACVLGYVDLANLALLLPGLVLAVVSICSAFAAYGDPAEPPRAGVPIRLKGDR